MLAGPNHLFDVYALHYVTQDYLLHDLPQHQGQTCSSLVPCAFAISWISVTETANPRTLLAHCPPNFGLLLTHTPLASLVLSFSSLKYILKLFQWALLSPKLVRQWYPTCHLQAWCCIKWPMIKSPKILPVTTISEAGIDLLALPVFSMLHCTWKERGGHHLFSWSINLLSQDSKVSLDCHQTCSCYYG